MTRLSLARPFLDMNPAMIINIRSLSTEIDYIAFASYSIRYGFQQPVKSIAAKKYRNLEYVDKIVRRQGDQNET